MTHAFISSKHTSGSRAWRNHLRRAPSTACRLFLRPQLLLQSSEGSSRITDRETLKILDRSPLRMLSRQASSSRCCEIEGAPTVLGCGVQHLHHLPLHCSHRLVAMARPEAARRVHASLRHPGHRPAHPTRPETTSTRPEWPALGSTWKKRSRTVKGAGAKLAHSELLKERKGLRRAKSL